ncbi:hypothetical protein F4604DRAFT_1939285 [Suillus subluteus]|nr:hypothetical protein F4604DRAFT_1939285 [Suillus subluteus]
MDWLDPHLCKLVYSLVVAVVSICGQFTTVIMATEPNTATVVPAEPKAQWNVAETHALLDHLVSHKSEIGDGGFKPSTFTSAATALAGANLLIYQEIQNYHNVSGAHWDNTKGAGIERRTALEGSINRIGDILKKAVTAAHAPAPPPPPPPPPPPLVATALDRAMILMQTEDAEVPAEELG